MIFHPGLTEGHWERVPNPARQQCINDAQLWLANEKHKRDDKLKRCKRKGIDPKFDPDIKTDEELEDEFANMVQKCKEDHPPEVWRWVPGLEA